MTIDVPVVHVIELLPAYALGSLNEEDAVKVAEHLDACPECRAELRAYEAVADRLALAAPDIAPPPDLKQRTMAGLQTPVEEPLADPHKSWWQPLLRLFLGAAPAWGIASLALIALLVVAGLWWSQRAGQQGPLTTPGGMQVIALAGTDMATHGSGTLVVSEDGEYGALVVDGLPALDEEHQYQLWLVRDGQRTSGGVFSVNSEGYGVLWIESHEPLSSFTAFDVTAEPADGSPSPTGDKVLGSDP
jgi:anti-sigma-K factor RskA